MITRSADLRLGTPRSPLRAHLERFERRRLSRVLQESVPGVEEADPRIRIGRSIGDELEREAERVVWLRERRRVFREVVRHASSADERRRIVLKTAREIGSSGLRLWRDARAQARWFDEEALVERFDRAVGESQHRMSFLCCQAGAAAADGLASEASSEAGSVSSADLWRELDLETRLTRFLGSDWDDRVGVAVLNALGVAVAALPDSDRRAGLSAAFRQQLVRSAQDRRQSVWRQIAALELLAWVEREPLRIILQQKLATPSGGDDFFVREHVVRMVGRLLPQWGELDSLLGLAVGDPSPFVRQAVARQLRALPIDLAADHWLELARDPTREVRGAAFDAVAHLAEEHDLALWLLTCVGKVLPSEPDPVVARIGIENLVDAHGHLEDDPSLAEDWWRDADATLCEVQGACESTAVRRWAAAARERLWANRQPAVRQLLERLREPGVLPRPGKSRTFAKRFFGDLDAATIGRALGVLAQDDFPLEVEFGRRSDRLTRGFRFRFRFWRLLHEARSPAPDKRQGFRHTIGRVHYGSLRAPSERLAELAETKVPGEPLYIPEEDGWRPFLPLLDDFLSILNQPLPGRATRFFTSQGVTTVHPPRTLSGRLRAWWRIGVDFAKLARLRNWRPGDSGRPTTYVEALEQLGYSIEHSGHEAPSASPDDDSVHRFFPALALLPPTGWIDAFLDYSLSLYENTLFDLALFVCVLSLFFVGRHAWANVTLRRARRSLGLVVGGWGTRGKSSVERLKAGLFNALGYGIVSKTTGCEAMILYAPAFAELRELFLFRPYDKATIWEQRDVTRVASDLGSDVLLWECMGLTPTYVDILQRQWMRDDLSTLTNTYPDHEDLQGPAGINIPMVMTLFIPTAGRLLASEEQMLPILTDAAQAKGTSTAAVGWKEAALVPSDVMARFPYEEHPYNIALVSRLAGELGVTRAFAYKEMADRVVPDLGVLKTYPAARVAGRELEFSNGMSANERHGCLGNWTRLGLDRYDPHAGGRWTTTLVNNRADRIPRSRVFAEILVADLSADRHFLIGGNLDGLAGYLDEAWERWVTGVELWAESGDRTPAERLEELVVRFRQPVDEDALVGRLTAMLGDAATSGRAEELAKCAADGAAVRRLLEAWGIAAELVPAIEEHAAHELSAFAEVKRLRRLVEGGERDRALTELRAALRSWFDRKIVVIDDYYATGDEIVERIAQETPPGFRNHIVGIQNIKGTGLDFVYRWLAWERCHRSCQKVLAGDSRTAVEGVEELSAFREYGPLSEHLVRQALATAREGSRTLGGQLADLDAIERELDARLELAGGGTGSATPSGFFSRLAVVLVGHAEDLLDAGDAIRRRKKADQIFRDLIDQRVSIARAIELLQDLTKRQKGGWLLKQLRARPLLKRVFRS